MRIRTAIVWGTLVHAIVACLACVALVVLTTLMHRSATDLATSMDAFRNATSLETQLLMHRLTDDPTARSATASNLSELAEEVAQEGKPSQGRLVGEVRRNVDLYLSAGPQEASRSLFATALISAHRLALHHLESANAAHARAAETDLFANMLGAGMALFLAFTVVLFLLWLWKYAVTPFLVLQSTLTKFAGGNANARVPERGPEEFRSMARTFNSTASGLQRAHQDQLRYTGAVLHDLRTPLSAIQLATQFVTNDHPVPSDQRIRDLFNLIRRQVVRINGIVGDSLGVLRAQSGDMALRYENTDACHLARSCIDQFLSATVHHRITVDCECEPIPLDCDIRRIEQLLNNLLSNAIKYSPPGSNIHVSVGKRPNSFVEFAVTDQGRGIAPEDCDRIFEPFQRAVSAHEEIPGVGLGLYVSRSVVEAHGGKLEVESELGKGTTFRALLPASQSQRQVASADP